MVPITLARSAVVPREVLDVARLRILGWSPTYDLDAGIRSTYDGFVAEQAADGELRGMSSAPEPVTVLAVNGACVGTGWSPRTGRTRGRPEDPR